MEKLIIGICFVMSWVSCQDSSNYVTNAANHNESGLDCKITSPAGELYAPFQYLNIPPFFNIGEFSKSDGQKIKAIILSERIKNGKKIEVDPVALFSFNLDSSFNKFLVVIPHDNGQNNLRKEYDEFLTTNIELKMAIENWFKAQCPINRCQGYTWENSYKALLELE